MFQLKHGFVVNNLLNNNDQKYGGIHSHAPNISVLSRASEFLYGSRLWEKITGIKHTRKPKALQGRIQECFIGGGGGGGGGANFTQYVETVLQ